MLPIRINKNMRKFQKKFFMLLIIFCVCLFFIYYVYLLTVHETVIRKRLSENELIGTWKLDKTLWVTENYNNSLIVIRRDGFYEIHNPPKVIIEKLELNDPLPKLYLSKTCKYIIVGKWKHHFPSKHAPPKLRANLLDFSEIKWFRLQFFGFAPPYYMVFYSGDPDGTPKYCWYKISKDDKCPCCLRTGECIPNL
jgi:hypothetical protein